MLHNISAAKILHLFKKTVKWLQGGLLKAMLYNLVWFQMLRMQTLGGFNFTHLRNIAITKIFNFYYSPRAHFQEQ